MSPRAFSTPLSDRPPLPRRWAERLAMSLGGVFVALAILWNLGSPVEAPPQESVPEVMDLRSVAMPELPPPPPPETRAMRPMPASTVTFEPAPSSSPVRLAPEPLPIPQPLPLQQPEAEIGFDFAPGAFKPSIEDWEPEPDRVYLASEVDQPLVVVYKKAPRISMSLYRSVRNPRVRVLFVVNTDGSVQDVHVLRGSDPEFDRLVVEAIKDWRFRPAIKRGKKVRCLAELPIFVKAAGGTPFSVD